MKKWKNWCARMPERYEVRTYPISAVALHVFGDASKHGVSAAVFAVVEQEQGTTQGLVCSKPRLAKKNLTISRLELVAGHMAVNLGTNMEAAIEAHNVTKVHCWLNFTVALYWINGQGEYRQFVAKRVRKIQEHKRVTWHHVPTDQNPTDIGSCGGDITGHHELWERGPSWLAGRTKWPPEIPLEPNPGATEESKCVRKVQALATSNPNQDKFDKLLETYQLRSGSEMWIQRFTVIVRINVATENMAHCRICK